MTTKPVLLKGIYIQVYRGALPGGSLKSKMEVLGKQLDLYKSLGITGVLMHGFTWELDVATFLPLEKMCDERGLVCIPVYGLNSDDPEGKAVRMASVANASKAKILGLDMEGRWEDEAADKEKARIMGAKLRELAPNILIIDQPWPLPGQHSTFPWEETAEFVDIRFPQYYINDWKKYRGTARYETCLSDFEKSWEIQEKHLAAKNPALVKLRYQTIQGYTWTDIFPKLIKHLITYDTLIVWSEPTPDDNFIKGIRVKNKLKSLGYEGPEAVKNFQSSTNGKLIADGICGPLTLKELGF